MIELTRGNGINFLPNIKENHLNLVKVDSRAPFIFEGWFISYEPILDDNGKSYYFQVQDRFTGKVETRVIFGRVKFRSLDGTLKCFNLHAFGGGTDLYDFLRDGVLPGERVLIEYDGINKFRVFVQPRF